MRAANAINLRMAPLTPGPPLLHRPGRQRAHPAGAHRDRAQAGRGGPAGPARRRDLPALQRAAGVHRQRRRRRRARVVATRRAEREASAQIRPRDWIGTVTPIPARLPVPHQLGLPGPVPSRGRDRRQAVIEGIAASPGRGRGHCPRRAHRGRVRSGPGRRHPRLPDDQPGMGRAVHQDRRPGDRRRRADVASGGAVPRVRHPGGDRHLGRDAPHRERRPIRVDGSAGRGRGPRAAGAAEATGATEPAGAIGR